MALTPELRQQLVNQTKERLSQAPAAPQVAPQKEEGSRGIRGFLKGVGKGLLSTVKGASSLGERGLAAAARTVLPKSAEERLGISKGFETGAERGIAEELVTPVGTAEKVGFFGEQIGELFIPVLPKAGKISKLARAGREAGELGAKTAIQTGEVEEGVEAAALGGLTSGIGSVLVGPIFNKAAPSVSKWLEKTNLRLTPTQKRNLGTKVDEVADFLAEKKIVGSPQKRFQTVDNLYDLAEDSLQKFLKGSKKKVARTELLGQIDKIKGKYVNNIDALSIEKRIDNVISTITKRQPSNIPLGNLNKLKRSTYKNAYSKAGDRVIDSVEHDIADVLRLSIQKATQGMKIEGKAIADFNREYGTLINARKLLKIAESRKQIGFMGKLLATTMGGAIGTSFGGPLGTAVGAAAAQPVAEGIAGTAARSLFGAGLKSLSKVPEEKVREAILRAILPFLRD